MLELSNSDYKRKENDFEGRNYDIKAEVKKLEFLYIKLGGKNDI